MATAANLLRPGDLVGGFEVEDLIGVGGMATVYRATQVSLGRHVALKVLARQLTGDEVFRERFRREGTLAASLEHPNIVPVYDSGEQDGLLYLAMRLVEGPSLGELLATQGVSADRAVEILGAIASALDSAHAAGLIHRDVKPQNILITSQGHPYLADFGVAKDANATALTATGGFVGSVNYASPEQIRGLTLTPASDIYALTAVLYHCLSGDVPYPAESEAGVMNAHLNQPPPTLPVLEDADSEFHTIFARGMAKDPGARYGHAGDLLNAAAVCVSRMPSARRKSIPAFPRRGLPGEPAGADRAGSLTAVDQRREPVAPEEPPERSRGNPERARASRAGRRIRALRPPKLPRMSGGPRRPSARRPSTRVLVGFAAAAVVVAAAAIVLSGRGDSASASTLRRGPLEIRYDASWHAAPAGRTYGLRFRGPPLSLRSAGATLIGGMLVNGAPVSGGVPATFAGRADHGLSRSTIGLDGATAVRYSSTVRKGAVALDLFVVPTGRGDVGVLCAEAKPRESGSCVATARSVRLVGIDAVPPGPDRALATGLGSALHPAATARDRTRRVAGSPSARIATARRMAAADRQAEKALAGLSPEPRDKAPVAALSAGLGREARALGSLARAAHARAYARYAAGVRAARSAGSSVSREVARLRRAGFSAVPALRALGLPPLNRPKPKAASKPETTAAAASVPAPVYTSPSQSPAETAPPSPESTTEPAKPLTNGNSHSHAPASEPAEALH